MKQTDVAIIGCGPAGIGASLALKEAGVDFLLIEKGAPGGKVNIAPRVDNYPGFTKIPGPELALALFNRVLEKNISHVASNITSLTKENDCFILKNDEEEIRAKYVIIASGTTERKIGLDKEVEFIGHGISYCAICDGHFYKGKDVVIIGGGNSALKEAIYLTNICSHVTVIHRRNEFRGNEKLVDELKSHENASIFTPYIPLEILGEDHVTGLRIQNKETLEEKVLKCEGLFPLVGQIPNTQFVNIDGVKNDNGTINVNNVRETSCPNLFAVGDVLPRDIKQIYLSEFDGKSAAKEIIKRIKG